MIKKFGNLTLELDKTGNIISGTYRVPKLLKYDAKKAEKTLKKIVGE